MKLVCAALCCCVALVSPPSYGDEPKGKLLSSSAPAADNGRYVLNGQYVLDSRTGRLWLIKTGSTGAQPVPYMLPDAKSVYTPITDEYEVRENKDGSFVITPKPR